MKRTEIKPPEQVGGDNKGEIVLYQPEGEVRLEVRVENETVWLMQAQMATLFGKVPKTSQSTLKTYIRREN